MCKTGWLSQSPEMRQRYMQLKDLNEHLLRNLENGQQELDQLNTKIESLQEVSSLPLTFTPEGQMQVPE